MFWKTSFHNSCNFYGPLSSPPYQLMSSSAHGLPQSIFLFSSSGLIFAFKYHVDTLGLVFSFLMKTVFPKFVFPLQTSFFPFKVFTALSFNLGVDAPWFAFFSWPLKIMIVAGRIQLFIFEVLFDMLPQQFRLRYFEYFCLRLVIFWTRFIFAEFVLRVLIDIDVIFWLFPWNKFIRLCQRLD